MKQRLCLCDGQRRWIATAASLFLILCSACRTARPQPRPPAEREPAGLAEPGTSVWRDLRAAPSRVGNDLADVFSSLDTWVVLGGAYLAGRGLEGTGFNDNSNQYFRDHSVYSSGTSDALDLLGSMPVLFAGAGAWYLWEDWAEDQARLDAPKQLLRSLASTGIATLGLKFVVNDDRPDGTSFGFPSGHASLTIATTTSLWYSFGPQAGIPAAAVSSLILLQRLDASRHDPDDIIGGATLGWLVASQIARGEPLKLWGADVAPAVDQDGHMLLSLHWSH